MKLRQMPCGADHPAHYEVLARNAARNGCPDIAEQASVRALELKAAEKAARRGIQHAGSAARAAKPAAKRSDERPALFMNGVFEEVLNEVLDAQSVQPGLVCYPQPYKPALIKRLQQDPPSGEQPWRCAIQRPPCPLVGSNIYVWPSHARHHVSPRCGPHRTQGEFR